jgi:Mg2+ and Co2+ transporter CorA
MLMDLATTALHPGLIWGFDFTDGQSTPVSAADLAEHQPAARTFRWLHMNLADQSTLRWIADFPSLNAQCRQVLLATDSRQQVVSAGAWTCLVLHDIERDFDERETRIAHLRVAIGPSMIITARLHPLRSADIVRGRIRNGAAPSDGPAALEIMLDASAEALRQVVSNLEASVQEIEDELLDDGASLEARTFVTMRALMVKLHRLFSGARATFKDFDQETRPPPAIADCLERAGRRLSALDSDLLSIQSQLRLLREELDLQATQRTNQNLYILSMMTALMMPATLVTGLFGMNTHGLPWANSPGGALVATLLAVGASATVYLVLRLMGFIRQ